jgi:hypothetical protein
MKSNIFEKGYKIHYPSNRRGYAELSCLGQNSILEIYKLRNGSWSFREKTLTDDILNELLPVNWQEMKYREFETMREFSDWLEYA